MWQAWVAKGRAQDRRSSAARIKAVKWASIAGLLAAAGIWSHLVPFEVVVRFLVTAGAMVVMFQAFQARQYAGAAVFGALALVFKPVGSGVQFFRRVATRRGGGKRRPVRCVTRLAQWEECEDGIQ